MFRSADPDNEKMLADLHAVSPALEQYTTQVLLGDVWQGSQLSARDRSIVTLSVLIARNQSAQMPFYLNLALDSGLEPGEITEIITHLAFYSGWGTAMAAVDVTKALFERRAIDTTLLAPAHVDLLPLDEIAEAQRESVVARHFGAVVPQLVQLTSGVLFHNLWLRPGLAPRDRCLVTVSSVVATAQIAQLPYYLSRAMDNGLTRTQVEHVMTHLAFYSGWSSVYSALPVVRDVFAMRADSPGPGVSGASVIQPSWRGFNEKNRLSLFWPLERGRSFANAVGVRCAAAIHRPGGGR